MSEAVAVLFLFVVMMLDMELVALREGFLRHLPLGALLALVLLAELILTAIGWHAAQDLRFVSATVATAVPFAEVGAEVSNIKMLGAVLYDDYFLLFQASGLVLLVAMIGAIVLTHRTRPGVRRQEIAEQVLRPAESPHSRKQSANWWRSGLGCLKTHTGFFPSLTHYLVVAALLFTLGALRTLRRTQKYHRFAHGNRANPASSEYQSSSLFSSPRRRSRTSSSYVYPNRSSCRSRNRLGNTGSLLSLAGKH